MMPPRSPSWHRPVLRTFTSLREVSLAATALRPLSLPPEGALNTFGTAGRY